MSAGVSSVTPTSLFTNPTVEGWSFVAACLGTVALIAIASLGVQGKFPNTEAFSPTIIALSGAVFISSIVYVITGRKSTGEVPEEEKNKWRLHQTKFALCALALLVAGVATLGGLGIAKILNPRQIGQGTLSLTCAGIIPALFLVCLVYYCVVERKNPENWS